MRSKILPLIFSVFLICGCVPTVIYPDIDSSELQNSNRITKEVIVENIYNNAIEIFESKQYINYEKVNGRYKIALNEMKSDLKYEIKYTVTADNVKLNIDESYVEFDVDNVDKINYEQYPILLTLIYE